MTLDETTQPCMSELPAGLAGREAAEKAAAGRQNLLLIGPPGLGAGTMVARRIPGILPEPTVAEMAAIARPWSLLDRETTIKVRPFRAPHYTVSAQGLVGTSTKGRVRPGEVSLAHAGVLLLDELPEFSRAGIEALADVLRRGEVHGLPAKPVMVVASASRCPCGWLGSPVKNCTCSPGAVAQFVARRDALARLLGLTEGCVVEWVSLADLRSAPRGEPSSAIRERVAAAWAREAP